MTTNIHIRAERVSDYAAIGALHARAFGNRALEPVIVALLRQRREFDPQLSLVAEIAGQIRGHILFSPYHTRLLGQTLPAVNLAPLAIEPAHQRQGIGGQLIREGHALAAGKGYVLSLVLGHSTYYPRFGYHTHAFGATELACIAHPTTGELLETRGPTEEDVPVLHEIWQHEEQGVDLTLEPGRNLLDWLSPHPAIQAAVYTRGTEIIGYTRVHRDEATRPRVFIARNAEAARAMLSTLASKQQAGAGEIACVLPLHPSSASAQSLGHAQSTAWAAGMVRELAPGPLSEYLALLQEGRRPPGRPTWPVAFDLE